MAANAGAWGSGCLRASLVFERPQIGGIQGFRRPRSKVQFAGLAQR
jgi:hypothetical protein